MSCGWCGHGCCPHHGYGHCHHGGYGCGPPPSWPGYGPGYGPPRRRRRALEEEDLAAYLEDLEGEIGRVREELESMRRSRAPEQS